MKATAQHENNISQGSKSRDALQVPTTGAYTPCEDPFCDGTGWLEFVHGNLAQQLRSWWPAAGLTKILAWVLILEVWDVRMRATCRRMCPDPGLEGARRHPMCGSPRLHEARSMELLAARRVTVPCLWCHLVSSLLPRVVVRSRRAATGV